MPRTKKSISSGLDAPLFTLEVPSPNPEIAERKTDLLEDCRYLGSYDWGPKAKRGRPVIVVPGRSR
jgi:hypothetical protein